METLSKQYLHNQKQIPSSVSLEPHSYEREVEIVNTYGIHFRSAALFVKTIEKHDPDNLDVAVFQGRAKVDGKSVMGLVTLGVTQGQYLKIQVKGNGTAEACMNDLVALVESGFKEDDEA